MHSQASRPARILLLSRGGDMDGEQRQLGYLVRGLDRTRFDPLLLLAAEGPLYGQLQRQGVDVHLMPMRYWRRFPDALSRYVDAARVVRRARDAGVKLVHASDPWKSPYALHVARKLAIPCVLHQRGPMSKRDILKHGMKRATAVIAIAQRYRDDLSGAGIAPHRIREIDDAVDVDYFRREPAGREKTRCEWRCGNRVAVGLVGRVEAFKQTVEFLEAIACLPRHITERALFLVIGREGPSDYMRRVDKMLAALRRELHVTFTGRCAEMPPVLSALDLLVTLSGGSVMFEAMACETAVLTARKDTRHSIHTRHGETAWCVAATETREIVAALERLIVDRELRQRLAHGGLCWVRAHLAASSLVRSTESLYEELLGT